MAVVEAALISDLVKELNSRPGTFATLAGVRESQRNSRRAGNVVCFGYQLNIRLANGRRLQIVDNEEDAELGTRQAPGLLLARRSAFLRLRRKTG